MRIMSGGYYGNANPDLLAAMPLDAARVLEIGCGEGALGARFKLRHPQCHFTGVEMSADAAALARQRLDRVIQGDAEALTDAEFGGPFDLVVMGDVLEHLHDPEGMLARLHGLLVSDGALVMCVPNIAHWSALREVLSGRWPVADAGLFDRTHRRFFTRDSLIACMEGAGFRPLKAIPRNFGGAEAARWIEALAPAIGALGLDPQVFRKRALALQYVVVALRREDTRSLLRLHQIVMAPRMMAARTTQPAAALRAVPLLHFSQTLRNIDMPVAPVGGGILILQRPRFSRPAQEAFIARARENGWVVVVEFDDDPMLVASLLGDPDPAIYTDAMRAADAVQTSTPRLADTLSLYNPETRCFPNAVLELVPEPTFEPDRPARIFYGALNRGDFARHVAEALGPTIAAHPDAEFRVAHDRAFWDALPGENKAFMGDLSYDDYLAALDWADIVLMPLQGTATELAKSDLKWVEAASRNAAAIVSPAVYGDSVMHGHSALIAENTGDWPVTLSRLIEDPAYRRDIAAAARAEVAATRLFAHQIAARLGWYRRLIARRDELAQAAIARMDGIR